MAMSLRSALTLSAALGIALASCVEPLLAQEATPEGAGPAASAEAPADDAPRTPKPDRLTVRIGPAGFRMRTEVSGSTIREETQRGPFAVKQVNMLEFAATDASGERLELEYRLDRGFYLSADLLVGAPGSEHFTDSRDIGNFGGEGNFNLARFESEYDADYLEWSFGGGKRVYPWKPRDDSKVRLDVMLQYRKSEADYTFNAGGITSNPFDPNAFFAPRFDPLGLAQASYDTSFETLLAGVRLFVGLTPKLSLESTFAPTWFGRYEGIGDLGPHGIVFIHDQTSVHRDPIFHTKNCDSDDPLTTTPPCEGLVDSDLRNPSLEVRHKSSRARGLRLDMNLDYRISDAFGIRFAYLRQDFRSVGGTENRIFGDDAAAGCTGPPDPNNPPTFVGPPNCPDESGKLDKAATVTRGFTIFGRFSWF